MPSPASFGPFATTNLAEILRMLVQAKQTGMLMLHNEGAEGFVALENGMILNAKTGLYTGMHALFQLVSWHEAHLEFRQQAIAPDLSRDLSVYDPEVLITGVAAKGGADS
jgi:hypothetical protein